MSGPGKEQVTLFGQLGSKLLFLLPVIGFIGIGATLATRQINFLILSVYLVVPLLLVSVVYMRLSRNGEAADWKSESGRGSAADQRSENLDESSFRLLLIAFLSCLSISIILLTISDVRPIAYYLAVVAMAVTILVEILRFEPTGSRVALILGQIMAVIVSLNWGVTLKYFLFIGRTDIMYHNLYISSILDLGHVTSIFFDYQPFPLWHILNASLILFTGSLLSVDKIVSVTQGLIFMCLPVLLYLLGVKLFKDQRIALLAALMAFFFPDIAYYSMSGISRSVAALLIVLLIILLIDSQKLRYRLLLVAAVTAAIITYHSISILIAMVFLVTIYLSKWIFTRKDPVFPRISLKLLAGIAIVTLTYWCLFGQILLYELQSNLMVRAPAGIITKSVVETPLNEAFNYLQYMPAVLFVFLGVLMVLLSKRFGNETKIFAIMALIFIWITYPGPQYLLNKLTYNFGLDRFLEYTYVFLIPMAAVGISVLFFRTNSKYLRAAVILLFAVWVMLSVSSDWVASDNPLVKRLFYTYYLTQPEVTAMDRLAAASTSMITTDFVAQRYLDASPYEDRVNILETGEDNRDFLRNSSEDIVIIRDGELAKRYLKVAAIPENTFETSPPFETYKYINGQSDLWKAESGYDRVYDSSTIRGYV